MHECKFQQDAEKNAENVRIFQPGTKQTQQTNGINTGRGKENNNTDGKNKYRNTFQSNRI